MRNLNLFILTTAQLVAVGGTVFIVTIGGIVGMELAPSAGLATLPAALMVVGTACGTVPAALIMQRITRRYGFMLGLCLAALAMFLAGQALAAKSFELFTGATALLGVTIAFSQQYRFAAAESVDTARAGRAISLVMCGSIGGALLGPELAKFAERGATLTTAAYTAMALYLTLAAVMFFLRPTSTGADTGEATEEPRSVGGLLAQPLILAAIMGGVVGQAVMSYVMTAAPISMHVIDQFSMSETADVVRSHVLAMYVPALATGFLIERFGVLRVMATGVLIYVATIGAGMAGHQYLHYSIAMIALGVGWNFLFVGGSTLLVRSYRPAERFRAQALNDFSVFTGSALATLGAGAMLHGFGWHGVLLSTVPLLLLMVWSLLRARRPVATALA